MQLYIYALIDPLTNKCRYVGKAPSPSVRLEGHIREAVEPWVRPDMPKQAWIRNLISRGQRPIVKVLEEVTEETWAVRESYWMSQLMREGCDLTNRKPGGLSRFATGDKKSWCVNLTRDQFNAIKRAADEQAISMGEVVRRFAQSLIQENKNGDQASELPTGREDHRDTEPTV